MISLSNTCAPFITIDDNFKKFIFINYTINYADIAYLKFNPCVCPLPFSAVQYATYHSSLTFYKGLLNVGL